MFTDEALIALDTDLPFRLNIDWSVRPSPEKYGVVNCLLAVVSVLRDLGGTCFTPDCTPLELLALDPTQRKVWERDRSACNIIGYGQVLPHVLIELQPLVLEVYFNRFLQVSSRTGLSEYYPSAACIVCCAGAARSPGPRSAGEWRRSELARFPDMGSTLIVDAWPWEVPRRYRRSFRGFKYLECDHKHFFSWTSLTKSESQFVANNGFRAEVVPGPDDCYQVTSLALKPFIAAQRAAVSAM